MVRINSELEVRLRTTDIRISQKWFNIKGLILGLYQEKGDNTKEGVLSVKETVALVNYRNKIVTST